MSQENKTVNQKNKNALCYIPLVAFFIHFTETKKTPELKKHIRYWIILFIAYSLLSFVLWWLLGWLLFIIYLWISWFLWYKAYNWEDINISIIDNFLNDTNKKDNNKSSDKDDDILNF